MAVVLILLQRRRHRGRASRRPSPATAGPSAGVGVDSRGERLLDRGELGAVEPSAEPCPRRSTLVADRPSTSAASRFGHLLELWQAVPPAVLGSTSVSRGLAAVDRAVDLVDRVGELVCARCREQTTLVSVSAQSAAVPSAFTMPMSR